MPLNFWDGGFRLRILVFRTSGSFHFGAQEAIRYHTLPGNQKIRPSWKVTPHLFLKGMLGGLVDRLRCPMLTRSPVNTRTLAATLWWTNMSEKRTIMASSDLPNLFTSEVLRNKLKVKFQFFILSFIKMRRQKMHFPMRTVEELATKRPNMFFLRGKGGI